MVRFWLLRAGEIKLCVKPALRYLPITNKDLPPANTINAQRLPSLYFLTSLRRRQGFLVVV
jgi:hypothetical protein